MVWYALQHRTVFEKLEFKYCNTGKSCVQSSELDAKSDTNEIKLMVTDHADGNRLSALYISVPRLFTSNWTELRGFYSGWRMEINITVSRNSNKCI